MNKLQAYTVYLLFNGGFGLFTGIVFTMYMVYQVAVVGLNPLQLVLVGTALEISVLVFEIPTGVVADSYSRRLSVIIGTFIIGLGFVITGLFPSFAAVLIGSAVWGFGWTFMSGAKDAWIADEIQDEKRLASVYIRGGQAGTIGGFIGIVLGSLLATIDVSWSIILGGTLFWGLGLFLIVFMPENGFKPARPETRTTWQHNLDTLREAWSVVRGRTMLMSMLLIAFAYGTYSEGYDRLWTKHLLDNATLPSLFGFDSILWFGVMKGLAAILSLIASEVVYRRIKTETSGQIIRVLLIIVMALLVALAAYAQMSSFVALILLFWGIGILRDLYGPLWMAWVNQHIPSEVRATMISATGQMDAFGQIAGGPIVGLVGLRGSTRAAISISGALLLPVVWLYTRALRPAPAPILAEVEVLQTESAQV